MLFYIVKKNLVLSFQLKVRGVFLGSWRRFGVLVSLIVQRVSRRCGGVWQVGRLASE
jgi:hypothetical protein